MHERFAGWLGTVTGAAFVPSVGGTLTGSFGKHKPNSIIAVVVEITLESNRAATKRKDVDRLHAKPACITSSLRSRYAF